VQRLQRVDKFGEQKGGILTTYIWCCSQLPQAAKARLSCTNHKINQLIAVLDSAASNSELNSEINSKLSPLSYTAAKRELLGSRLPGKLKLK